MPGPRKVELRHEMAATIKATARQQMSAKGTAGLSLRAIARQLGVTAPAIYNYFPRLDDLITALIVDAFNAQADAIQAAVDAVASDATAPKLRAALLAYRQWAVDHPTDFQLIYGNPIPGYEAPTDITTPLASRPGFIIGGLLWAGYQRGEVRLPPHYADIPPSTVAAVEAWKAHTDQTDMPTGLIYGLFAGWTRIHGMTVLEILQHTPPVFGDTAAFYANEVEIMLGDFGLTD